MFPLRGQFFVPGDNGPTVFFDLRFARAVVDHWFNGKGHAFPQYRAGTAAALVQYPRGLLCVVSGCNQGYGGRITIDNA